MFSRIYIKCSNPQPKNKVLGIHNSIKTTLFILFNNVLWVPTNLIGKISYFGTLKLRGLMFETYMDRKRLNCVGYKQQKINFSI